MKKHLVSFAHQPKKVAVLSIIIAGALGVYGYMKISQERSNINTVIPEDQTISTPSADTNQNLTLGFLSNGRIKTVSVKAGDSVKSGQVLATLDAGNVLGSLTQAKASYTTAQANYNKVINGATGSAIDVAKASVNTAQVNLDGVTNQQNILVKNAHINLLNSSLVAKSDTDNSTTPPIITGTYNKETEGVINITVNQGGSNGQYFNVSGIVTGTGVVNTNIPEPILDTGLFIQLPPNFSYIGTVWKINIPNTTASNYLTNYNAYQSALETQTQAVKNAQALLDQAKTSLTALATAARPEDVASAQAQVNNALGMVQIAEAAYKNTIITAPSDGKIISITISPGQIAIPNAPAIEFMSENN